MPLSFAQLFASNVVDNAAPETLFTLPASPSTLVLRNGRIRFSNTTVGSVTIKAWAVPSGGSAADSNVFLPTVAVGANSNVDVDVPIMAAGGFVQAQAGAAASITALQMDGFTQT
ncbi:MAG: hypothetical protein V4857_14270 [Pseudomonadota bacterium]